MEPTARKTVFQEAEKSALQRRLQWERSAFEHDLLYINHNQLREENAVASPITLFPLCSKI